MCEEIRIARIIVFFVVFIMMFVCLFFIFIFCKKRNININEFSGAIEMYRRVFKFENKIFSIFVIACMYGGALLVMTIFIISLWAEAHGCVFPTRYS
ncbi:hypothetical protein DLF34_23730 [Salmonella enterica subsp. enterica serovar Stuttgart]|nr:hypothetical protein [Salmonella enterica subsp. enterica serovar Stuttgart]